MERSDDLARELAEALKHMHDPEFQVGSKLAFMLGFAEGADQARIRNAVACAVHSLRPSADEPPNAKSGLLYQVLHLRYIAGCTQECTAESLGVSVRHLNRLQWMAVQYLTQAVYAQHAQRTTNQPVTSMNWKEQASQSLEALNALGDGVTRDLAGAVQATLDLLHSVDPQFACRVKWDCPVPVSVDVHPSALRQVLLAVVPQLCEHGSRGGLRCHMTIDETWASLVFEGDHGSPIDAETCARAQQLLAAAGGRLELKQTPDSASMVVQLPLSRTRAQKHVVLLVDDSEDLNSLFMDYCAGTPYELVCVRRGLEAISGLEKFRPDIILMDVMLPDMDGWDILRAIHDHPLGSTTPVIVCSVMANEQLARALGAQLCLQKPIWRDQLLASLANALSCRQAGE